MSEPLSDDAIFQMVGLVAAAEECARGTGLSVAQCFEMNLRSMQALQRLQSIGDRLKAPTTVREQ